MLQDVWKHKWIRLRPIATDTGQGRTYLACAIDSPNQTPTHVLKELKHQQDMERRGRMHQEVAALERLDHPGVARCADSNTSRWTNDEELFLVTEYIPGKTLREYVGTTPVPLAQALQITQKLLDTLEYCHKKGIVHRDIKPDNVIIRNDNPADPVLIDFGLAYDEETRPEDFATPTGQQLGNRFYALPEYRVAGADKRDAISDLTLLVAILFYLLTGIDPEVPLDDSNQPPHKRHAAAERLSKLSEGHESALRRVFDIAFASERIKRWSSIEVLRRELGEVAVVSTETGTKKSFEDQLKALHAQFSETPSHVISKQITFLGERFLELATDVNRQVAKTALSDFEPMGAGMFLPDQVPTGTRFSRRFMFLYRYDRKRMFDVTFYVSAGTGEIIIMALQDKAATEVARVGLFDPQATDRMRDGLEQYYLQRISAMMH